MDEPQFFYTDLIANPEAQDDGYGVAEMAHALVVAFSVDREWNVKSVTSDVP
jgi:hypothetical protein